LERRVTKDERNMKKNRINMAMRFLVALLFVVLSINIFGSEYDEWYDSRGWWNISWKDTKTGITYQAKATFSFGNYTYLEDCYASISSDGINKEIVDFEPLSEVSFPAIKDGEGNITKYTKVPVNRIMGTISGDNIKSISFPESIVYFGYFNGGSLTIECDNLQTIKFGDNNKIKDADNFCVSITSKYLESLIIPDGVKGLGYSTGGLDLHCPALKTVTIPKSVKLAGGEETPNGPTYSGALGSNCPNLETICFNDDVTTIPSLFGCCFNLKNIEWPSKVEKIENYAFLGCTGLQSVKFPKTLNAIGRGAFLGCSGLKDIYVCWETPIEDEHYDTYLKSVNGEWVMSTITTFSGAHDTEKIRVNGIVLPTDEMINPGTYENAILHLVQDSPNEPGPSTYKYKRTSPWKYFRHIKHPGGLIHNFVITVTANGNGKVEYDHWTTIDDGQTTTVETCEVRNETKDFKVSTPTLPTEDEFKIVLDEDASLKSVTVDGKDMTNNVEIEQNTNTGILLLSNITGATTIDVKFSGAEDPKDNQTFTSKSAEGVEVTFTILNEQKKTCMVGVDNSDKTWLNAITAIDNSTTGKLTIPEKANGYVVEKVGDYAFYSCKISEVVLPEGLTSIGAWAFANCPITSVTLPSTLTFIGSNAFTKLETIYSYVINPFELSEKAFNYINYQVAGGDGTTYYYYKPTLYVPYGTKDKYASTPSWNHFMDNGERIFEMEDGGNVYNDGDSFIAKSAEGIEIKFVVVSASDKTCKVGDPASKRPNYLCAIDQSTTGNITVPSEVNGYKVVEIDDRAFFGCNNLTGIVIPNTVTSIGWQALSYCSSLSSISVAEGNEVYDSRGNCNAIISKPNNVLWFGCMNTVIPDGVTQINSYAFLGSTGLKDINIPNTVKAIAYGAFGNCSSLSKIFIPKSIISIDVYVFHGCNSMTSMKVDEANTVYDSRNNCNAILETSRNEIISACKKTFIPSDTRSIGLYAFSGVSDIERITIPEGVTDIKSSAFTECPDLVSVSLPSTLKNIGFHTFRDCPSLKDITFSEGLETIGNWAFNGCPIKSVKLPSTLKSVGQYAFGWDGIVGHERNDLEEIYCYVKEPFELSEKAFSYNRYIATSTGEELFRYTGKLYVPSGTKDKYLATPTWNWFTSSNIIEMGQAEDNIQFADSNVKAICVQNWDKDYDGELSKEEAATVKNIGTVFKETQIHMFNELQYFTGLTAIGNNAFRKCQMLTSIILPESIQKIGENAFTDCRELSALEIPATVTEIGQSVFAGCNHLIVTVAQGNKTFVAEDMMLYQKDKYGEQIETLLWCSPMKSGNVTINSAASTLADNCFYECGEIIGVEIPDNVKTLGDGVFVKCSKLENVRIGKGVESIGEGCFNATPKLRQITVYASNPYYAFDGGVLIKRQGNVLVAYPNAKGVQYKVREGIEAIGKWAFYYTNIASVTLPETLSSIEDYAFYDCKNLTEIIINTKMVPEVAAKSFGDVTFEQATLTVPAGMKSQYQTAEVWKNFKNIVEMQDTGINGVGVDDKAFNVYDMNGHKIRSEATSLESLPKGVYIINGRKVVK
jgi:hypothetical protein